MKKTILLTAFVAMGLISAAKDEEPKSKMHGEYCTKMKDGKLTVMHEGKAIMSEVTLADGSKIKPDGMLIKKDGTSMMLKDGQCIDKNGKMHEMMGKEMKHKK